MACVWKSGGAFFCLLTIVSPVHRPPSSLTWSKLTRSLTTTLLQCRPRCLATPCRVAQGAGTRRHLASTVITVHVCVRTGLDCACFHAAAGACVRGRVFVCVSWRWFKTHLGLIDMFRFVFFWSKWATATSWFPPFPLDACLRLTVLH